MSAPKMYRWTGETMEPLPHIRPACDREFVVGEVYRMEAVEARSELSHRHEFAWLKEAWLSLPEKLAAEYPSPEHLRKRALIEAGYYNEQIVDAGSNAAAIRVASAFRSRDDFIVVIVRGPLVAIREAKSQSRRAMKGPEFQASKTAIMEVVADLLGVAPETLGKVREAA